MQPPRLAANKESAAVTRNGGRYGCVSRVFVTTRVAVDSSLLSSERRQKIWTRASSCMKDESKNHDATRAAGQLG
jgi:hypothetical protein